MAKPDRIHRVVLLVAIMSIPTTVLAQAPATSSPAWVVATVQEWVLPGTFTQGTSLADLETRFGADNVRRVKPDADTYASEAILFPDDPTRRAHVSFHDCEQLDQLRSIEIRDRASRWRGKHGVHVGMSFEEVRARNGKGFGFSGFGRDGFGRVHDQWSPAVGDDATLGKLDVEEGDRMYFDVMLGIRSDVPASATSIVPRDEYIASDDPRIPQLAPLLEVVGFGASTSLDDEWD